jgi:hypothetical protein
LGVFRAMFVVVVAGCGFLLMTQSCGIHLGCGTCH